MGLKVVSTLTSNSGVTYTELYMKLIQFQVVNGKTTTTVLPMFHISTSRDDTVRISDSPVGNAYAFSIPANRSFDIPYVSHIYYVIKTILVNQGIQIEDVLEEGQLQYTPAFEDLMYIPPPPPTPIQYPPSISVSETI